MQKEKKLIFTSICISFAIHFISLIAIHSKHFINSSHSKNDKIQENIVKDSDLALEKAFSSIDELEETNELFLPLKEETTLSMTEIDPIDIKLPQIAAEQMEPSFLSTTSLEELPLPSIDHLSLTLPAAEELSLPSEEKEKSQIFSLPKHQKIDLDPLSFSISSPVTFFPQESISSFQKSFSPCFSIDFSNQNKSNLSSYIPTLDELKTINYSDDFEMQLAFIPEEDEYFFAVTLAANPDLEIPRLRQHFDFLIDRSNSIEKTRLHMTKQAVYKAIESLSLDDSFNIFSFDSKVDKFSSSPQLVLSSSLKQAKQFLDSQQLGSFFSPANLYKPLLFTIPNDEEKIHTAILLTDGESLRKKQNQREFGLNWSLQNQGKVSLFCFSLAKDPNQQILNITSSLNRGKLIEAPSERGMKRKLLKWMKNLSRPVASHLNISIIPDRNDSVITIYPQDQERLSHLYLDLPYVILGKTKHLDSFTLLIQGKSKEGWLHIKKKISFDEAKAAPLQLKKDITLHESYDLYHTYLKDFDTARFDEIRSLLKPFDLPVAFE